MLIENVADVNAAEKDKWTALYFAAQDGHADVVKVLIQNGMKSAQHSTTQLRMDMLTL